MGGHVYRHRGLTSVFALLAFAGILHSQDPAGITVRADQSLGPLRAVYRYFGYDEPNYTYMPNGRKLVKELAGLGSEPTYFRTHFLLATGNGEPGFKWGSTNVYTEDARGNPVYDWTIADRIFQTYLDSGGKPFVEIGFMPRALSTKPDPYEPVWSPGASFDKYYVGWAYPPKDYAKFGELVFRWVRHAVEKWGAEEVASWYWEVWNEPDIAYWRGTPEEYDQLYDYSAAAVKRALPQAKIGGPATTDPASPKAAAFLRRFLEHCDNGKNYATGAVGAPLDFITFHAKGRPAVIEGRVRMGLGQNTRNVDEGCRIVASFPRFRNLPIILSESDPEGCAACSARVYPQNAYRNTSLYASYTAAMIKNVLDLSDRHKVNISGMLTWAFEFEGQPYFDGFRTLATNGIDKPILNVFRMAGLMSGNRVKVESTGAVMLDGILTGGVTGNPDVDAIAARTDHGVSVLLWNYHDDDVAAPGSEVRLAVTGLPGIAPRVLLRHYRIDANHSNAFTAWRQTGSPQEPSPEEYSALERAGQLQLIESPKWLATRPGGMECSFQLPRQGVSLVQFSWDSPSVTRQNEK
jgi:xylan 1,4-beta-xylosidase